MKSAKATIGTGTWELEHNEIWNVPDYPVNEVRGDFKTKGPFNAISKYTALAVDKHGNIYGERSLQNFRESGYDLEGRVSVGGKKYRAFTSSVLFQRKDGSLCNVAALYVCK